MTLTAPGQLGAMGVSLHQLWFLNVVDHFLKRGNSTHLTHQSLLTGIVEFHFIKLLVNPDGAVQNRRNTPKPLTELLIVKLHYEWYRHRVLTRQKNAWKYIWFWCSDFDCRHAVRSQQSLGEYSVVSPKPDIQNHNPGLNMNFFFMCRRPRLSRYLVFFFLFLTFHLGNTQLIHLWSDTHV